MAKYDIKLVAQEQEVDTYCMIVFMNEREQGSNAEGDNKLKNTQGLRKC